MAQGKSTLEDESLLRWGFLEDERDGCAVVSDRMELIYLNEPARALVPLDWFGRRCFEIFPTANELCAFNCPTRTAVHEAHEILYCEEDLRVDGRSRELGVAVVPLEGVSGGDEARSLLLLRAKDASEAGKAALLGEARRLLTTIRGRFEHG